MFWDRVAGVYDLFANYSHIRSFHTSSRIFFILRKFPLQALNVAPHPVGGYR